ncbi:MAG: metallopeptidase TldD-related protein [Thermoanaerobaculia bacterium]|nr:metallopeptidase TldD-related protein [Thermoanaerobaculia bacterium]
MTVDPTEPLNQLDVRGIARALSQIADRPGDLADAFFERAEVVELPPETCSPGLRMRREEGLAVRLLRGGNSWLAARDRVDRDSFHDALRRTARAMPRAPYPLPDIEWPRWSQPLEAAEVQEFPSRFFEALRLRDTEISARLSIRRFHRSLRVVGSEVSAGVETESFYSLEAESQEGRRGLLVTSLIGDDAQDAAKQLAARLSRARSARDAAPPDESEGVVVLGPAATAVLLHEAVAHALEADLLALDGHPEGAIGVQLGSNLLDLFDDPSDAPTGVKRTADDEGFPVVRRCLLRAGKVEQPLADAQWAHRSELLVAGAGRRGTRHDVPGPRSSHLHLVAGESTDLFADAEGGLFFSEAERGRLDPASGFFTLVFPWGQRILNQTPGPSVGRATLRAHVSDLLHAVRGVGKEVHVAGAGWCAKDGILLPVWATAPGIRLEGLEVGP